jgi:hypothetical protein
LLNSKDFGFEGIGGFFFGGVRLEPICDYVLCLDIERWERSLLDLLHKQDCEIKRHPSTRILELISGSNARLAM